MAPAALLPRNELSDVQTVLSPVLPPTEVHPVWSDAPVEPPSNVTLVAPVRAPLDTTRLLDTGPPNVNASDKLPTPWPPVNPRQRACCTHCPVLHRSADAEVQRVLSEALETPREDNWLYAKAPPLRPKRVTLVAPVAAALLLRTLLTRMLSAYEKTNETLPAATPDVATMPRVHELCAVCIPETDLDTTDDSDVQTVVSPRLPPTRVRPVKSASPPRAPSNVTLAAPVRAAFATMTLLGIGPINENASETLPAPSPDVDAM
jgi:hypothetical protein